VRDGWGEEKPAISCLLPVYNGARYFEAAVRSVLNQTFQDFELILVDDGSTDDTPELIARFAAEDPRIVPLRQPNGGIVAALNNGLAAARGEYVARMDADDICLPDRFEFQLNYLRAHPECVLVGGLARTFSDTFRTAELLTDGGTGGRRRHDFGMFPPRLAVSVHPLIMLRAAALRAAGGYRRGLPFAEDYDLYIRIGRFGEIHNPPRQVLRYRVHEGSVSIKHMATQEWAALASEFEAMRIALPEPPADAGVTIAPETPELEEPAPAKLAHAYFWFRMWRRLRLREESARTFARFRPFLLGLDPEAWTRRGVSLRRRMLISIVANTVVAKRLRAFVRMRRGGRTLAA
jgi:glycosyltransferase involved in cell wall biosynthesis